MSVVSGLGIAALAVFIAACGRDGPPPTSGLARLAAPVDLSRPIPKGGGRAIVGKPYAINGTWYFPAEDPTYDRTGIGSWYGTKFHGRATSNGEIFDLYALTAAHPTLPLPSYVEVTNLDNGRRLVVRVNDRGAFVPGRILDVSWKAATVLGYEKRGTARIRVVYLGPAPLNGDDSREQASARALTRVVGR